MAIYKHLKATRTNAFGVKSSVKSGLSNKRASIKGVIIFPIFLTTPTPYQQFFNTQSAEILTHFGPLPISSLPLSFMYAPNRSSFYIHLVPINCEKRKKSRKRNQKRCRTKAMCVFFGTRRWLFQRSQTNLVTMRDKMEVSFLLDGLQAVSSSLLAQWSKG